MRSLVHLKSLGLVFGIALLVAAALVLLRPQADRLARYKTTLAAQGEKLSLDELEPRFSESAAAYQSQLNEAAGRLVMAPIPPSEIEPMKKTAPGGGSARLEAAPPDVRAPQKRHLGSVQHTNG